MFTKCSHFQKMSRTHGTFPKDGPSTRDISDSQQVSRPGNTGHSQKMSRPHGNIFPKDVPSPRDISKRCTESTGHFQKMSQEHGTFQKDVPNTRGIPKDPPSTRDIFRSPTDIPGTRDISKRYPEQTGHTQKMPHAHGACRTEVPHDAMLVRFCWYCGVRFFFSNF